MNKQQKEEFDKKFHTTCKDCFWTKEGKWRIYPSKIKNFIDKLQKEEKERTIKWAKEYIEVDMKMYGTEYTSLKLSKLLAENGFEEYSKFIWADRGDDRKHQQTDDNWKSENNYITTENGERTCVDYYAYDILNDLCVKYAKEMFGEDLVYQNMTDFRGEEVFIENFKNEAIIVLELLQQNKQDKAEEYIWENCLFNPKNK